MRAIARVRAEHSITVSRLATVEVPASLARRQREGASEATIRRALAVFEHAVQRQFQVVEVDRVVCDMARSLLFQHPMRAYDTVQLASALAATQALQRAGLPGLTFVTADLRLLNAAATEGLAVEDPNQHT